MLTSIAFSGSPHQLNRRGLVGLFPCVTTGNNKSPQLPPRYILIVFLARGGAEPKNIQSAHPRGSSRNLTFSFLFNFGLPWKL